MPHLPCATSDSFPMSDSPFAMLHLPCVTSDSFPTSDSPFVMHHLPCTTSDSFLMLDSFPTLLTIPLAIMSELFPTSLTMPIAFKFPGLPDKEKCGTISGALLRPQRAGLNIPTL